MNFKQITIAASLTTISLIAFNTSANASAYRSANTIYLELQEGGLNSADGPTGPIGTATYKRGTWTGSVTPVSGGVINLPNVLNSTSNIVQGARRLYVGTFTESSGTTTCTGDITILHYSQGVTMLSKFATITRTTTGGTSSTACTIGTTNVQAIASPRPYQNNVTGDFTTLEANTLKWGNTATWWRWRTVNATQCHSAPSNLAPSIPLSGNTALNARFGTGFGNQISTGSTPWLKVNNPTNPLNPPCYVRANISDIQAVWLGF